VLYTAPSDYLLALASIDGDVLTTGLPYTVSGAWQPCPTGTCAGPDALVAPCTVTGTNGNDLLEGTPGDDVICGLGGNDRLAPGAGQDIVRGGPGTNTLDLRQAEHAATVDLRAGTATGNGTDALFDITNVQGSAFNDVLKGDPFRNVLSGNDGDDDILGFSGDDTLLGGAGNDYFRAGKDDDDVVGEDGSDRISFSDSSMRVRVNLGSGTAAGEGADIIIDIERISGSRFDDFIVGSNGHDVIHSGDGIDTVQGSGGDDAVYGGDDKDYLYGQGGDDDLDGEDGADYLDGGGGEDSCADAVSKKSC
jgi:Ca2+-binding RTX toxin-like protein